MSKKTILLVDDTETVLMTQKMMLRTEFELEVARNGEEALKRLETTRPDLVLLDVMMPKLNGIETCRRIRQDPRTAELPIVMVTTLGEEAQMEEAFAAGCNAYLTKPFNKADLMARIREHLG